MTLLDFPTIDCVQQRIKRKLEDFIQEYRSSCDIVSVRMKKHDPNPDSPSSTAALNSFPVKITTHHPHFQPRVSSSSICSFPNFTQFFVRMISGGKILVLHGNPKDKIMSIDKNIQSATGIPIMEQTLFYGGKQLHWEQTLSQCGITYDFGLHLVGQMRSTGHPHA
ncbi:unnamed protein product [Lactuca saligna]|uniref:Ubiquitin-like domain-containing protein n=1 Tax=Lactuca saligna TaxID=75948 RepID=A0AA35V7N6_LACSI|nr:unnamed protein product [Lactuca saligna]